ncbi:MAG: hypothetical protein PHQ28_07335, partial [Mycobacterium sp.]|nr:hypothetical protein [Mycobacterium sp.]
IDAIIAVSVGLSRSSQQGGAPHCAVGVEPIAGQSSSECRIADDALRPLTAVVRSARMAAVNAILHSAWAD